MKLDFLLTVDWDYYKRFMSVNQDRALVCTRAVYRKMANAVAGRSSTNPPLRRGCIPNFYGLAKTGVNRLTQQLSGVGRDEHSHQCDRAGSDRHEANMGPTARRRSWPTSSKESH